MLAAEVATPEGPAFLVRHTSGFVRVALPGPDADRLDLPPMVPTGEDGEGEGTAYAVTVDAAVGIGTGISATDRAHTVRLLADPATRPADLTRPGHVVPVRARVGGVLRRAGHPEAAVDLARLAGLRPAGVLCELVNDDGTLARPEDLRAVAARHDLALVSIADLVAFRQRHEGQVVACGESWIPTAHGTFRAIAYSDLLDGGEHLALVLGDMGDGEDVLVRVHSECLAGDVVGSLRCDCRGQLDASLAAVAAEGQGLVLYVRAGRGEQRLLHRPEASQLLELGADTVHPELDLGQPADARDYGIAAQILADLGVGSVRLLSNHPDPRVALEGQGVVVRGRVPLSVSPEEQPLLPLLAAPVPLAVGVR